MYELLAPVSNGVYLDIGCGTGNYLAAFCGMGLDFYGIDPSETMLQKAHEKARGATLLCATADSLPIEDNYFDGATAMFTFHHWDNKTGGLRELHRVLKPGARLVFLTFTGEQMRHYWLNHYFPEMMKRSWELLPELPGMEHMLNDCGFRLVATENYFIQDDLQDFFLYSHKRRPDQYLLPEVRQNISSFSAFCEEAELHSGLQHLQRDIDSGMINEVMCRYESVNGDYLFLVAENIK
jgi:SAM-dependent methyltransferase